MPQAPAKKKLVTSSSHETPKLMATTYIFSCPHLHISISFFVHPILVQVSEKAVDIFHAVCIAIPFVDIMLKQLVNWLPLCFLSRKM
jgi:hypothetical protein